MTASEYVDLIVKLKCVEAKSVLGFVNKKEHEEMIKNHVTVIDSLLYDLSLTERAAAQLLREKKLGMFNKKIGCGTDEAERAFDAVRTETAKKITRNMATMSTEEMLAIARESFINGFKKARV